MFKKVCMILALSLLCLFAWADYSVDFEGPGETKGAYAAGDVSLSGISWNLTEVMIGTDTGEAVNGARAARFRGYGASVMTMLQDKTDGIGTISFYHKRYNTSDPSIDWKVEYSTNGGSSWQQAGANFSPTSDIETFTAEVNVPGDARIRILPVSYTGSSNRRMNIDDILITDYVANLPSITLTPNALSGFSYEQNHGPSTAQTYTISAANLTPASGNISISAADAYEFSTTGSSYQSTLTLSYSGATLSTSIYVRLKAGLAYANYAQTATHSGGGATAYLGLSGSVTPPTILNFNGSYSQDFTDFISLNTLPNGWCVDEDIPYIGNFGYENTGGLRGNGVLGMQLTGST
ncbi:MAG: ribonuclease, partial [Candidatus Cloacimonadaceae bacterium]